MRRLAWVVLALAGTGSRAIGQDSKTADRRVEEAAAAELGGDVVEAARLLREALDADGNHLHATIELGRLLCENGEGGEGMGLLYRALKLDPKCEAAAIELADVLLAERDWYESQLDTGNADAQVVRAREMLERYLAAGGARTADIDLTRVRVLSLTDDATAEAFAIAAALVKGDPENQRFHSALVDAASAANAFEEALALYDEIEVSPWLASWFRATALAARAAWRFNHFEDDDAAVADYLEADRLILESGRLEPQYFEAASERSSYYRSYAGWIRYTRQQRTEEAWDLFTSALGRLPTNENAIEGLSWVGARLYEAGDLETARELYRQACIFAPERSDFWNNYGLMCRDTGQFEESFRAYRRGMALAPSDARIVNDCALILQYHLHRDLDLAERWYIQAEDLARAALQQARDYEDSAAEAEHLAVLGDALVNLARLYADQGRVLESAEHWNELREVDPSRPELPENGDGS